MSRLEIDGIDWEGLRVLRSRFVGSTAGAGDYWHSRELLESYDRTFGERIGWKWNYVLDELELRRWRPPPGGVLDWGCGTGVAGRRFLARFPHSGPLSCFDRSARAESFARDRAVRRGLEVGMDDRAPTVLVSHVISELDQRSLESLLTVIDDATSVVWVEPGDRVNAVTLQSMRDRLLGRFSVAAPCTHQNSCPLLDASMERHWCHHFAESPPEAFTDPGWGRFISETGIDLRSAPLSFVVLDRRPLPATGPGAVHSIGRPRVSKPEARVFGCDATGVTEARITRRRMPDRYRDAKKGTLADLARWEVEQGEVTLWEGW